MALATGQLTKSARPRHAAAAASATAAVSVAASAFARRLIISRAAPHWRDYGVALALLNTIARQWRRRSLHLGV